MKLRVLSGAAYVAVLVAFFLLKIFVGDVWFDGFLWLCAVIGTFEMTRACGIKGGQRLLVFALALFLLPAFVLFETVWDLGEAAMLACFLLAFVAILSSLVVLYDKVTLEDTAKALLCLLYPSAFLALLALVNHGAHSLAALLLIFVTSPLSDTFAHAFGTALHKKFPKKMAPVVSPNKTVIGGIGGLLGGGIGGLLVWLVLSLTVGTPGAAWQVGLFFCGVGLLCGVCTEFGDLVESAIKRKVGIKDMGSLLPGHGGILDRIDGTLYVAALIYAVFVLISLF